MRISFAWKFYFYFYFFHGARTGVGDTSHASIANYYVKEFNRAGRFDVPEDNMRLGTIGKKAKRGAPNNTIKAKEHQPGDGCVNSTILVQYSTGTRYSTVLRT